MTANVNDDFYLFRTIDKLMCKEEQQDNRYFLQSISLAQDHLNSHNERFVLQCKNAARVN